MIRTEDPTLPQRARQAWRVLRGQAYSIDVETVKRAANVMYGQPLGGEWGEPPPAPVTATPLHYLQSEAVHAAVDAFANRISSTALHLYREARDGELEEIKQHPALTLLENPNPFLTRTELIWHLVSDRALNGNHYWFLAGPSRRAPTEIWRCNPRLTEIVRHKQQYIAGYVTEIDGLRIPLDAAEVIHFRRATTFDEFYGIGDLAAAAMAAQTGYEMNKWNRGMFGKDYGVPAGIVNIEGLMSDPDYDRMKAEWKSSYGGAQRRTAFLRGGKVQFLPIGLSQTDVDFLNGAKWEAEKIYRVFGTYHLLPAQFADDRKVNERLFLEEHAWPLLVYLAEVITDQFLTFWGPKQGVGRLVAQFEDIRPRERALDLAEEREESKGLFFNEWRIKHGLPPKPGWDDVLFVQAGKVQAGPATAPPAKPAPGDSPSSDAQDQAERRESANDDTGDDVGDFADKAVDPAAVHRELARWERFSLRHGGTAYRPFKPDLIPPILAAPIQAALDRCAEPGDIKAVFVRMHDLVDGRLPDRSPDNSAVKGSFGTPDGTVVLYLAAVEDLLVAQQALQQSIPADAPVRWTPREQLHVTVVHSAFVDEPDFSGLYQDVAGALPNELAVRGSRLGHFDGDGPTPLVLFVETTPELQALQRAVYSAFVLRGVDVSPTSAPGAWRPHITLGYFDRAAFAPDRFDGDAAVTCTADSLAFTRGAYETVDAHWAGPDTATAEPQPVKRVFLAGKAIQATRLDFEADFETVLTAARDGDVDRREWAARTRTLLRKYGEKAYRDGLNDGGVVVAEQDALDDDDRAEVNRMLAEQSQYVTELGAVLFDRKAVSDDQAALKPSMWFNKSIMPFYQSGRLSADKNGMHEWVLGNTEEHCATCRAASGQRHRLKDWHARGIIPQADVLECKGFQCDCNLVKTREQGRGRFSDIPLHE